MSTMGFLETVALLFACIVLPSALAFYFSIPRDSVSEDYDYR